MRGEAAATPGLGRLMATAGRPAEAIEAINAALPRFDALEGDGVFVGLQASLSRAHMLNGEFAPAVDRLTATSSAPLMPGPDGRYPVPRPGQIAKREY